MSALGANGLNTHELLGIEVLLPPCCFQIK